jgi:hypothetical protein
MVGSNAIGKVTATEGKPTTCATLRFWLHREQVVRPFDVVRVEHMSRSPGRPSHTYAIIQDLLYITDSAGHLANYVSSDFGSLDVEPYNARLGTTIAEAEVLYNDQEIEMPVRAGATVEWADVEGVKEALGIRALKQPIPAGYMRMSNGQEVPIEFEAEYLLGPEGAHLNVAGISGLATKTSYVMFLLRSIQQSLPDEVSMVIFNVKGRDLLSIDEENPNLTDAGRADWRTCGLEPQPFVNVTYLYPYARKPSVGHTSSHADMATLSRQIASKKAFNYIYDVETGRRNLAFLFSDIDDPNSTMDSIVHQLPEFEASDWSAFRTHIQTLAQKGGAKPGDISVLSWRRFSRLLQSRTDHDLFTERSQVEQDAKRQVAVADAVRNLRPGSVLVVDIESLPDYLQCLVVGDVVRTLYGIKLGDDDVDPGSLGTVIVFADELNKYAPKSSEGSRRTLTQNLLEITERGRSLRVILFGAEQFRSGVHDRVLGNCSTNVFGRTSPSEIAKSQDYRYFPEAYRSGVARLPKGTLLLQHAAFKSHLVKVHFPLPAYRHDHGAGGGEVS